MAETSLVQRFRQNERIITLVNYLLTCLMLACVVVSIVRLGESIFLGWEGDFLVGVGFVIALEGMYSRRVIKEMDSWSREWLFYRGAEWVVILSGLKLVLYLVRGIDQLWIDLPLWRQNFIENFFTDDYLLAVAVVFLTWMLAGMFAEDLEQLEGDEKVLRMEADSGISQVRPAARRSLVSLIFLLGGVMVALTAIIRLDQQAVGGEDLPAQGGVVNIMVYFALGLILLSLTQFSILRAQWALARIPISPNLAGRWAAYSLVLLSILGILALALPNRYSVGLVDLLGYFINFIIGLLGLLLFLLITPILFLFSLVARLFGQEQFLQPLQRAPIMPPPPPAVQTAASNELLRSILFWALFLGVLIFSIYNYLRQHKEIGDRLRQLSWARWFERAWIWIAARFKGVNQKLASAIRTGLRLPGSRDQFPAGRGAWGFLNITRLSPRQRVLFFYLAMVRRGGEKGVPRKPDQTPYEYSQRLKAYLPEVEREVASLTGEFVEARYSLHEIPAERASLVKRYWDRIRLALRQAFSGRRGNA